MKKILVMITAAILILTCVACGSSAPSWPGQEWERTTPEKQGMDSASLNGLADKIPTTADIVIVRNGYIVYEYHNHEGYEWGVDGLAGTFSVTKSFTSALIGLAIDDGYIDSVEQAVTEFFPEWAEVNPGWDSVTIEHLLTMTGGYDWPESTTWNYSTLPMRETENWVDFVIVREFIEEPGVNFNYSTGGSQLLTAIIRKVTGKDVIDYARERLFDPIGIGEIVWDTDPQGIQAGGRGIWLSPADLARFGLLFLNNGNWDGEQILSQEYVHTSTQPRINGWSYAGKYAYHWWTSSANVGGTTYEYYFAMGFGGQFLFVVPDLDLVAVFIAQNPQSPMTGKTVFEQQVLGSIKK